MKRMDSSMLMGHVVDDERSTDGKVFVASSPSVDCVCGTLSGRCILSVWLVIAVKSIETGSCVESKLREESRIYLDLPKNDKSVDVLAICLLSIECGLLDCRRESVIVFVGIGIDRE